jgi:hypothetical protein
MTELERYRRRKTPECLSDLQIDEILIAEARKQAPNPEHQAALGHTLHCPSCAEKLAHMRVFQAEFSNQLPLATISAETLIRLEEKKRDRQRVSWRTIWRRALIGGLAAATAAMLVVVLLPKRLEDANGERLKGAISLGIFCNRGGSVFRGLSGGSYLPGDKLRFIVGTKQATFDAVFNIEQSGKVTVFYPLQNEHAAAGAAAPERVLPGAVELDQALGKEYLIGIFCPASFDLQPVAIALAHPAFDTLPRLAPEDLGLPANCAIANFLLVKVAQIP